MAAPSMPSLLEGLQAWWEFDENFTFGHTAMDSSGNGRHIPTEGSTATSTENFGIRSASSATGKNGGAILPTPAVYTPMTSQWDFGGDGQITIAGWIKVGPSIFQSGYKGFLAYRKVNASAYYSVGVNGGGRTIEFTYFNGTDTVLLSLAELEPMEADRWYYVVAWMDPEGTGKIHLRVDDEIEGAVNGPALWTKVAASKPFYVGSFDFPADDPSTTVDGLAVWNRVLTSEERSWLYNGGKGRVYDEIDAEDDEEIALDCVSDSCCAPTEFGNEAECSSGDASVAAPILEPCRTSADVLFDPPSGSLVVYPIFVRIYSTHPLATIRYTTDGSTPTDSSPIYASPVEVTDAGTVIKARAYVTHCPDSDVTSGVWPPYVEDELIFCFMGQAPDKAGKWGEFAPNGDPDLQWWLEINNLADSATRITEEGEIRITEEGDTRVTEDDFSTLGITRFELYQLDEDFRWTTGQAWSTDEFIRPPFDTWDQDDEFHVFPLVFFDQTPTQLNSAYTSDWGTLPSGSTKYNLFGQHVVPPTGYFMLIIYFDDGTVVRLIGDQEECDEPPPCPTLDSPALTGLCKRVDVSMIMPGAAKSWELYAASCVDPQLFTRITFGSGAGVITYSHTGLLPNCTYCYYWRVNWSGDATYAHCGWVASATACVPTSCEPSASLAADPPIICLGQSADLDYITECSGAGTAITLLSGVAGNLNVVFPQNVTPNTSGTITLTPTATGTWTFRLTAPSILTGCTSDTSDVTLQVVTVPDYASNQCSSSGPWNRSVVRISAYRQGFSGGPLKAMDQEVVNFSPIPSDGFYDTCTPGAPSNECSQFANTFVPISSSWSFILANPSPATHCYWAMNGQRPYQHECARLLFNKPISLGPPAIFPDFYYYGYVCPSGGPGGTSIYPAFTNKWVLQLVAKLLCGTQETSTCVDSNSIILWRGIKDCAGGPVGEYISDWHSAAPDAAVETRAENSHIYMLRVV